MRWPALVCTVRFFFLWALMAACAAGFGGALVASHLLGYIHAAHAYCCVLSLGAFVFCMFVMATNRWHGIVINIPQEDAP